jgi:hypothetical protein
MRDVPRDDGILLRWYFVVIVVAVIGGSGGL